MFRRFNHKIFLVALFALSIVFSRQILAAGNILQQYKAIYSSNTPALENWGKSNLEVTAVGFLDATLNVESIPDEVLVGNIYDKNGQYIVWTPGGMIGTANNAVASLFTPSASGVEYIAQVKDSLLGKPAYAQNDSGAGGLMPLLPIWRQFRNIVYILSSLIFIAIGIMVILRVKISPQAVITVQNAIPQLIITLVLVTFSYAIAGLLIDASNLLQGLFGYIIWPATVNSPFLAFVNQIPGIRNLLPDGTTLVNPTPVIFLELMVLPQIVSSLMAMAIAPAIGGLIGIIAGPVGVAVGTVAGGLLGTIGSVLVLLLVVILMIINLVRLVLGLVKVYATIIFKIIVSPLEIGMGAFPGSKMGFSSWFTDLIANLAVFPIVFIFLLLLNRILFTVIGEGTTFVIGQALSGDANLLGGLWAPGILGGGRFGALGPSGSIAIFGIAFAGMSILSKLPELVPALIFQLKNPWGQAIGQATATPKWVQQGGQMTMGTGATMVANKLTAEDVIDPNTGANLGPRVKGWKAGLVNLASGFAGGKPRGA